MQTNLTINATGSMLMGAGLTQVSTNLYVGLLLVGVGAILQILVAFLNKEGVNIQSSQFQG